MYLRVLYCAYTHFCTYDIGGGGGGRQIKSGKNYLSYGKTRIPNNIETDLRYDDIKMLLHRRRRR